MSDDETTGPGSVTSTHELLIAILGTQLLEYCDHPTDEPAGCPFCGALAAMMTMAAEVEAMKESVAQTGRILEAVTRKTGPTPSTTGPIWSSGGYSSGYASPTTSATGHPATGHVRATRSHGNIEAPCIVPSGRDAALSLTHPLMPGSDLAMRLQSLCHARGEFAVVLADGGPKKIQVIKEIRGTPGLDYGLKEAKDAVEMAPCVVAVTTNDYDAREMVRRLEDVGATATLVELD